MPNGRRGSLLKVLVRAGIFARMAGQAAVLANTLFTNNFSSLLSGTQTSPRIRLGVPSFQKIKQPLRNAPVFTANPPDLCVAQVQLTLLCGALGWWAGAGNSRR